MKIHLLTWLLVKLVLIQAAQQQRDGEVIEKLGTVIGKTPRYYNNHNPFYNDPLPPNNAHPCKRECRVGQALSCYYKFVVHYDKQMGPECLRCKTDAKACKEESCIYGDGTQRELKLINSRYTGPPIEVCIFDKIVIDVHNQMSEPTSIHWHGMHMSDTPDMDGVPFVSQYPIQAGEAYRYRFDADRVGTVWYHGHVDWQRSEGLLGSMVIRQPWQMDPHAQLYDNDLSQHTLLVHDVVECNEESSWPVNILIDGKGRNHENEWSDNDVRHRYKTVKVYHGKRYRFRVMSGTALDCPIEVSIQNHTMLVISNDGNDILPEPGNSFFVTGGERIDFILMANQRPGLYWIRFMGHGECASRHIYQGVVLRYKGTPKHQLPGGQILEDTVAAGRVRLNIPESYITQTDGNSLTTAELKSLSPVPWPENTSFTRLYAFIGDFQTDTDGKVYQFNRITHKVPSVLVAKNPAGFNEDRVFCNISSLREEGRNCLTELCECSQMIRLPADEHIEIVMGNLMSETVPMHLHGHDCRVVGMGIFKTEAEVTEMGNGMGRLMDERGGVFERSPSNFPAIKKDTVQVFGKGYAIIRFVTKPGYWTVRAYNEQMAVLGIDSILKIGEHHEMKKLPTRILI